jgi:hypothetical protein
LAYAKIYFENSHTGQVKEAPVGFSWTVLLFGFFPPLFRAHWGGFVIILLAALITFGLSNLVFMFIYNRIYIKHLISEGYKAKSASANLDFIQKQFGSQIPRLSFSKA